MKITRTSPFSGKTVTKDLPISEESWQRWTVLGWPIQRAMPELSADDREFILTGISPEEWDEAFGQVEIS